MKRKSYRANSISGNQMLVAIIQGMALLAFIGGTSYGQVNFGQRSTDCILTVTSPQSGDVWEEGGTYSIEWQKYGLACGSKVNIDLYKSGTLYWEITIGGTENDGDYSWEVPAELGSGEDFSIVIYEPYPSIVQTESPEFAIHSSFPPPPSNSPMVFPVAAKIDGACDTHWATDLIIHNAQDFDVFAFLYFCESGKDNTVTPAAIVLVPGMQSVKLNDVVTNLFGKSQTFGFITMFHYWIGPQIGFELQTASRTYNDLGQRGTYGQEIPGISKSKAIPRGRRAFLLNLTQTDQYRANIGFSNVANFPITVIYKLFKENGTYVGEGSTELPPFGHTQINEVIRRFTSEPLDNAFIQVTSPTDEAYYFAYASVVDNRTGDPSFILAQQQ